MHSTATDEARLLSFCDFFKCSNCTWIFQNRRGFSWIGPVDDSFEN